MWGGGENSGELVTIQTSTLTVSSPVQVGSDTTWSTMDVGRGNTTAIKTDGTLWAWGYNPAGQLAQNHVNKRSSPVQIPGTTWESTSSSLRGSLAVKTDGTLWAWGSNTYGQLGQNDRTDRSSPVQIPGTTWNACHRKGSNGNNCVASKTDGTMWVWGRNGDGNLGIGNGPSLNSVSSPTQIPGTNWAIESYQFVQGDALGFHLREP